MLWTVCSSRCSGGTGSQPVPAADSEEDESPCGIVKTMTPRFFADMVAICWPFWLVAVLSAYAPSSGKKVVNR